MKRRIVLLAGLLLIPLGCGTAPEDGEDNQGQDASLFGDTTLSGDGQELKDSGSTETDVVDDAKGGDACSADDLTCDGVDDDCDGQTDEDAATGDCDDGNPCTTNGCVDGKCQSAKTDGACDDGDACTSGDACKDGLCTGAAKDCDDGNPCTKDQCNPKTGDCGYAIDSGASCDDGDPCTESDACEGAKCVGGAAKTCPAGAVCTVGVCDSSDGSCSTAPAPDGAGCDDGDPCSIDDTCAAGACKAGAPKPCTADKPCDAASCDSSTGQCVTTPVADGKACNDGNPCTQGEACLGGACKGSPIVCDDLNPCTTDACDIAIGCTATNNTNPCDDTDPCTVNDVCAAGTCLPGSAKTCDDSNPCTSDACDKATGGCKHTPSAGGGCNDGDACTLQDVCNDQGGCEPGKAKSCDDGKPCTIDSCDKANGKCSSKQAAAGSICDDGSFCTIGDKCDVAGVCKAGQKVNCVDNNPCTVDTCVAQTGQCAFQKFPDGAQCDDGDLCSGNDNCQGGKCAGKAKNCDDANSCTTDSCDGKTGKCKNVGKSDACDDSNACTTGESCASGSCKAPVAGTSRDGFGVGVAGFVNGDLTKARVSNPAGSDHAADGRVFLADRNNHRVRLYTPGAKGAQVSTYAGSGSASFLDGAAASARFNYPADVAWHAGSKTLYVADRNNHRIRKIVGGKVSTLAGSSAGNVDGPGNKARFNYPEGVDVTVGNVLYVCDTNNHKIRRLTPDGQVLSFAGTGSIGYVNGAGNVARFNYPRGLVVRPDGSLLVADTNNHRIRKVDAGGVVTLFAGSGSASFLNGAATSARFNSPQSVALGASGAVLVADTGNRRVRRILAGQVTTYSGSGASGSVNGAPTATSFSSPQKISVDVSGQAWVSDAGAHKVRILGTPSASCNDADPCTKDSCDPKKGCAFKALAAGDACSDGSACTTGDACSAAGQCAARPRPAVTQRLHHRHLQLHQRQVRIYADPRPLRRRRRLHRGRTAAPKCACPRRSPRGSATARRATNGTGSTTRVNYPRGLDRANDGFIYLADRNNHRIRKISPSGTISLHAGNGLAGNTNGNATSARFYYPSDVAVSVDGTTVYVADRQNHRIRRIVNNTVSTLAGSSAGFANGQGTTGRFYYPEGIATDPTNDTLVVADSYNNRIRRVTNGGAVTTIAGSGSSSYKEGKGTGAYFYRLRRRGTQAASST